MSNEKMREEFETAVALEAGEPVLSVYLSRRNETYSTSALHFAWWAWKASREAIDLDLSVLNVQHASYNNVDCYAISDVCVIVREAGLKVKS